MHLSSFRIESAVAVAVAALALLGGGPSLAGDEAVETIPVDVPAEEAAAAPVELEAISVTAEKTGPAPVRHVPLSLSIVDSETIDNFALLSLADVVSFTPNVQIEDAGYYVSPRIRGLSVRPENVGFEPPAGVAVDGITYGRIEFFGSSLFDVSRVEVLRGPQSMAFGKNTTAGMIHVVTTDPTEDFTASFKQQVGDFSMRRTELAVGGGMLGDTLLARVAWFDMKRDGLVKNTTAAVSSEAAPVLQGRDDGGYRLKLRAPNLFGAVVDASYEHAEQGSLGTAIETLAAPEAVRELFLRYDPGADLIGGNHVTSLDFADFRRSIIDRYQGSLQLPIGEWGLTAIAGRADINTVEALDVDFTPVPATTAEGGIASMPYTTYEMRLVSPGFTGLFGLTDLFGADLGSSDFLIGAFQQDMDIVDSLINFRLPRTPFLELAAATKVGATGDPASGLFGLIPPGDLVPDGGVDEVAQGFNQRGHSIALFAQTRWQFLPDWTMSLGGRFSREEKDAHWVQTFTSPGPLLVAAGFREMDETRVRVDDGFQPRVALSFAPWEVLTIHAHWAESFKSGGFNAFAFRPVDEQLVYGKERTTDYGLDVKSTLLDGILQVNASLYRLELRDFQYLTKSPQPDVVGLGVSQVANAPEAVTRGLELDATWHAVDWARLQLAYAFNDSMFKTFPLNSCAGDASSPVAGQEGRCDASGRPFPFAPRHSGVLSVTVSAPWWNLLGASPFAVVGAQYATRQYLDTDLDERQVQGAVTKLRARLGVGDEDGRWAISVGCTNCTDEVSYFRMADVNAGIFSGIQDPPRQVTSELRFAW